MSFPGITLVIPSIAGGGAEKIMTGLANWWANSGGMVSLITFRRETGEYPLDGRVRRIFLDDVAADGPLVGPWPEEAGNIHKLRIALSMADSRDIIAFLSRMNMRALLAAPAAARVVVCERSYPPLRPLCGFEEALRKKTYRSAHKVALLTRRAAQDWALPFLPPEKVAVIPNPVLPDTSGREPDVSLPEKFILAAGRLVRVKGFDVLVDAFAIFRRNHPEMKLVILGEGPEDENLKEQAARLGLGEKVLLPGKSEAMRAVMSRARMVVLPSYVEGFPNILLEAMAAGTPCVASDCPSGPAELIKHGVNGLLFAPGDKAGLAECMRTALTPGLGERLAEEAKKKISALTPDRVFTNYTRLFAD